MRRRIGAIRREEILKATVDVLALKGFARTRVQDVAEQLGVSPALVFYHFDSKERLLCEAFEFAEQRDLALLEEAVTAPGTARERLVGVLRIYLGETAQGWWRDIDSWSEGRYSAPIRAASQDIQARWRQGLRRVVTEGVTSGEFACDDPQEAVLRIAVLLDGLAVATQVRGSLSRQQAFQWVCDFAAVELGLPTAAHRSRAPDPLIK